MSDDLADFLLARIDEDEAAARGVYSLSHGWRTTPRGHELGNVAYFEEPEDAVHVARWSPDRVLAECAAKRAIVDDFRDLHEQYRSSHSEHLEGRRFQALIAVGQLALAYVDHPDWREEFRP